MRPATTIVQDRIRELLQEMPGITHKHIIAITGLAPNTVTKHMRAIRAEWEAKTDE